MSTNFRTLIWTCGHTTREDAGSFPAETRNRDADCLDCRNAEMIRLNPPAEPAMSRQAFAQDGDQSGLFRTPVYPPRVGVCGMCRRPLSSAGHPSDGVCDNV
jgi:hypothetical protein